MFIIIVVALLLGIWRYRSAAYFKWVAITFVWMLAWTFLFNGGGTLENPAGDGLIAHQMRVAANDGPMMGVFAIFVIIVLWGGIIYFLNRARKAANAVKAADEAAIHDPDYAECDDADTSRKALETIGLLLLAAAWFYFNYSAAMSARNAPAPLTEQAPTPVPPKRSIEEEVMGAASEENATTPTKIDAVTTLERVTASGRMLSYHYKVQAKASERDALRSFVLKNVVPKVCMGELRPRMKQHGISYSYSYTGTGFSDPVVITVSEQTCAKMEP